MIQVDHFARVTEPISKKMQKADGLMVTHAYRPFNGLKFGLISTHISSFIEIGRKMTKLSSEKAIFSTKISQA